MKQKQKMLISTLTALVFSVIGVLATSHNTYAALAYTDDQLYTLSILSGVEQCYQAGIKDKIQLSEFEDLTSILKHPNTEINIPTHIGNTVTRGDINDLTCKQAIKGYNAGESKNSAKGFNQLIKKITHPEDAGYKLTKKTDSSSDSKTEKIAISDYTGNTSRKTVKFSGNVEISNGGTSSANSAGAITATYNSTKIASVRGQRSIVTFHCAENSTIGNAYNETFDITYQGGYDNLKSRLYEFATGCIHSNFSNHFGNDYNAVDVTISEANSNSNDSQVSNYTPGDSNSITVATIAFAKNNIDADGALRCTKDGDPATTTSCRFGVSSKYALYYRYVQQNGNLTIQECSETKNANATYSLKNAINQWCVVAIGDQYVLDESYSIVNRSGRLESGTMTDVLEWLNNEESYEYLKEADYAESTISDNGTIKGTISLDEQKEACYDGAGTFGWLLCPAIQATSGLASDIYGMIERDYLKIDTSSLFDLNGANGGVAYNAWDTVRNIANIVFAIFILVIIFSQLTGVGIDNYGIKRVLPRIIIAAILVNASWFICRIAIDLSNVVGLSLGDIINPGVIEIDASVADMAADKLSVYSSYVVTFGGASAIGLIALFINPGLILSVLLALLVVVFAVIFFWLILVAREVVVVLLIILAPLAFVCFLFPNTEKLFKRWLKIAEAAIILYPLCTLVVSGGRLVGAIMAEQANAYTASIISTFGFLEKGKGMRLAAMLVQVIPYFFIPMLLKNSMAGLGNLGAKISGLGSRLGRGLSGSIRKSDGFQNAQERSLERKNRIRAGLDKDGNIATGKRARFAQIAAGGISKRTVAKSRNAYLKTQDEKYKYGLLDDQDHLDAARISQEKAAQKAAMADQMVLVNDATRNGEVEEGDNGLFAMYDEAMNSGNTTRARAIAEIAGRRKDTAAHFLEHHDEFVASDKFTGDKGITADVMKQIATGDGAKNFRAADGVRFEYASQYNKGATEASFEEWRQSGDNVSTAIEHNITSGAELYGQKNSSIGKLAEDVAAGKVSETQLRQLRRSIDSTKSEQFQAMHGDATKDVNVGKLDSAVREQIAKIDAERARQNEAAARSTEEYWKDQGMFDT